MYIFFIYIIHFLSYFTPRIFSVIDVMELVYSGGFEIFCKKSKSILKLSTNDQGVSLGILWEGLRRHHRAWSNHSH